MLPILLTAFEGQQNASRAVLEGIQTDCHKCILPNHKADAAALLLHTIHTTSAACVIMLGQKPRIKDKIAIEPVAVTADICLHTPMDCTVTKELLNAAGYAAYISDGCGNSYCNHVYYACLSEGINGIFLHII